MSFGFAEPTGRMASRRSAPEAEMRAAVVAWIRANMPAARVVHELNVECGETRADVAAIDAEQLVLFEIKSPLDTLKRLEKQHRQFRAVSHATVVVAARKWWFRPDDVRVDVIAMDPVPELKAVTSSPWIFPALEGSWRGRWEMPSTAMEPHAARFLGLLWRDELQGVCNRYRIVGTSRSTRPQMIRDLTLMCTGREITRAVCGQLRARPFAEADEPIAWAPQ